MQGLILCLGKANSPEAPGLSMSVGSDCDRHVYLPQMHIAWQCGLKSYPHQGLSLFLGNRADALFALNLQGCTASKATIM